jgi:MIP family channel proteins
VRPIVQHSVAEFIGTFALVFIGAGAVVIASTTLGPSSGLVGVALAHALVLAIMISAFGHFSGGHFNPAVTVSVWVAGKVETVTALVYILVQLAGAAAGAGLLRLVMPEDDWKAANLGATLVSPNINNGQAVLLEAVLTFFLVITVFAVAVDDRGVYKSIAGLPIGLVLGFDILVGGPLTGASMNPARTFGPALMSGTWTNFWVYVVGPILGGLVAASVYMFIFLRMREVDAPTTEVPIGGEEEDGELV